MCCWGRATRQAECQLLLRAPHGKQHASTHRQKNGMERTLHWHRRANIIMFCTGIFFREREIEYLLRVDLNPRVSKICAL